MNRQLMAKLMQQSKRADEAIDQNATRVIGYRMNLKTARRMAKDRRVDGALTGESYLLNKSTTRGWNVIAVERG